MPEAFAVLLVFVVCIAAYVGAQLTARDPARQNVAQDIATLRQQRAWLEQRLAVAQNEGWGAEMVENVRAELAEISRQLANLDVRR